MTGVTTRGLNIISYILMNYNYIMYKIYFFQYNQNINANINSFFDIKFENEKYFFQSKYLQLQDKKYLFYFRVFKIYN